jgi:hypothetical protein
VSQQFPHCGKTILSMNVGEVSRQQMAMTRERRMSIDFVLRTTSACPSCGDLAPHARPLAAAGMCTLSGVAGPVPNPTGRRAPAASLSAAGRRALEALGIGIALRRPGRPTARSRCDGRRGPLDRTTTGARNH